MGNCTPIHGKVGIFIADTPSRRPKHRMAYATIDCYVKGTDYKLLRINLADDTRTKEACSKHKEFVQFLFRRHCAASIYVQDVDWLLILDTNIGVVNPNHCIEEWIDDRVDVILYETLFTYEISAASLMVRNSKYGKEFLTGLAEREFNQERARSGAYNGVIHQYVLDIVIPDAVQFRDNCHNLWLRANTEEMYMEHLSCVKQAIGATRLWPGKVRIYRRAHAWVRESFTGPRWHDLDFMIQLRKRYKYQKQANPFPRIPDLSACGGGLNGWQYRNDSHISTEEFGNEVERIEDDVPRWYPEPAKRVYWITMGEVGDCYPDCDKLT
ncbi:hypothetical protein Q1695_014742 [Nippostrongylus brasiliensis]|nr:hypothetical protein Q1695_014742 [Nippostrongylus brasiliensis]